MPKWRTVLSYGREQRQKNGRLARHVEAFAQARDGQTRGEVKGKSGQQARGRYQRKRTNGGEIEAPTEAVANKRVKWHTQRNRDADAAGDDRQSRAAP